MPITPKSNRKGQETEKTRGKNKLTEKSSSFHGRIPAHLPEARIRRPKTLPNLLSGRNYAGSFQEVIPKLTKLLLNVTIQGSVGAVQVVMTPESTVGDLIAAALQQYTKEGRRPNLTADSSKFDLHYSQFSLESLDREEKVTALGSRNFFLCQKRAATDDASGRESLARTPSPSSSPSCSKEVEKAGKSSIPWLKFMDFML